MAQSGEEQPTSTVTMRVSSGMNAAARIFRASPSLAGGGRVAAGLGAVKTHDETLLGAVNTTRAGCGVG
jgi:hypothetical protein